MSERVPPTKIVILGGGIAALASAWQLTNDPDWRQRYDITVHTLGWRLGGKCASSRNMEANGRIEEHGIHGFLGCYYNALKLMFDCYTELNRPPGAPLATARQAFLPVDAVQFLEFHDGGWSVWPVNSEPNDRNPWEASATPTINHWIRGVIEAASALLPGHGPLSVSMRFVTRIIRELEKQIDMIDHTIVGRLLDRLARWTRSMLMLLAGHNNDLRRALLEFDYVLTIVRGVIADNIVTEGFDVIDDEDYTAWLKRHGAHDDTLSSPLAVSIANTLFAYPHGDTTLPPTMAASVYVQWALKQFAYLGSIAWKFAAGTGETVIAPLYLVLKQRGVHFEFFHKVESLQLTTDGKAVASIRISVQADVTADPRAYDPLIDVDGLPCWPSHPLYEQLKQGDELRSEQPNLESYWSSWHPVGDLRLVAGRDFDRVIYALSLGAVPETCRELLDADPRWRQMVAALPTVETQSMQIWLSPDSERLGWAAGGTGGAPLLTGTYMSPMACVADFSHLLRWERWQQGEAPKTLLYFCGPMAGDPSPPLGRPAYPADMSERVKWEGVQYLQAATAPIFPGATARRSAPAGDPLSLDFRLLSRHKDTGADGVFRIDQQFWRANIDPTERYVTSPPGSARFRLKPSESGFENLTLAGDWTYTGLNAGCVEAAVISGMLASHAIAGTPDPASIPGYQPHRPLA